MGGPHVNMRQRGAAGAALLLLAAALAGCVNPNKQVLQLQQELAAQKSQNDTLRLQARQQGERIEQLDRQLAELNRLSPQRWTLIPRADRLEIGGYSGLRRGRPELGEPPTTQPADGPVDLFVRLYLKVLDGEGFEMRAAGPMTISLFDLSGDQPRSLGVYRFDAEAVGQRYRSALGTQLFAFDLAPSAAPGDGVTVRVEFTDLLTGKTLTAQKLLTLSP